MTSTEACPHIDNAFEALISLQMKHLNKLEFKQPLISSNESSTDLLDSFGALDANLIDGEGAESFSPIDSSLNCDHDEVDVVLIPDFSDEAYNLAEDTVSVPEDIVIDPIFEFEDMGKQINDIPKRKRQRRTNSIDSVFSTMLSDMMKNASRAPSPSVVSLEGSSRLSSELTDDEEGDTTKSSPSTSGLETHVKNTTDDKKVEMRNFPPGEKAKLKNTQYELEAKVKSSQDGEGTKEEDTEDMTRRLLEAMQNSMKSQKSIREWDRKMGLKASHSATMQATSLSRKKLRAMLEQESPVCSISNK